MTGVCTHPSVRTITRMTGPPAKHCQVCGEDLTNKKEGISSMFGGESDPDKESKS